MSDATARKFNNYTRLPYDLLAMFPHGQAYVLGDVFSFTGDNLDCHRTYKSFGDRAGSSRATVGRALRSGKAQKLITVDKEKGYVFNRNAVREDSFLRVPDWVRVEEFDVRKNKRRRLLKSEVSVYSYIYTRCDNKKKSNKFFETSVSAISEAVHLCERTVLRALWTLIRAGLIYRPKKDKGVNAYKKSRYTLNYKLIRAHEKQVKIDTKPTAVSAEPQRPKTFQEIEQYYKDKRERAEFIAERNFNRANENERFKLADGIYKSLMFSAAYAMHYNSAQKEEFERRAAKAQTERLIALRELGMTEKDLDPQYECKLCNDTGQLDSGAQCQCYPRGAPMSGGNVGVGEQNK